MATHDSAVVFVLEKYSGLSDIEIKNKYKDSKTDVIELRAKSGNKRVSIKVYDKGPFSKERYMVEAQFIGNVKPNNVYGHETSSLVGAVTSVYWESFL